jgi:hypothetical protein
MMPHSFSCQLPIILFATSAASALFRLLPPLLPGLLPPWMCNLSFTILDFRPPLPPFLPGLADRIIAHYDYAFSRNVHQDEEAIMHGLSRSLQMQLVEYLYSRLYSIPLFKGKDSQFRACLAPVMKLEYYSPGEWDY